MEITALTSQLFHPSQTLREDDQRATWVRDVTGLMLVVILIAAVLISIGTLAGFFLLFDTIPIYILLLLIAPAWWAARHNGWKWARFIPVVLCFALGVFGSINGGFFTNFVLFYAMSVILAGMLLSSSAEFLMVLLCTLAYAGNGYTRDGFSIDSLAYIITFTFGLFGLALLRWYVQLRLQEALEAQLNGNELLRAEIHRREKAELVQREQEKQLRRLADNTSDMVTEMDPAGIIRYASPSYRSTMGYDPQMLLGTDGFAMLHPDDLLAAQEIARQVAASRKPDRIEVRARCVGGHYIWVSVSGTPLYNEQGKFSGFVLASRDITLQKQAEETIRVSEKKFRKIIQSLPLGVHMFNLQVDGSLVLSGYNPAAERILGVDHSPFVGSPIEAAFPGLTPAGAAGCFHEIAKMGGQWSAARLAYDYPPIQGVFEVHAFQTEPGKMVSVFADITQRIQDAEDLRFSEEKFSTAFRTSPDSININRLSDGVFLDINQGFTRLMGYTPEDVLGKSSLELDVWVDPQDRARLVKGLLENGVFENLEAKFRRKDGSIGIGLMSARIIVIQEEKCILSITHEITLWLQAQVALRETHAKLERAYEATLEGWARALELRERETANHSRRVVEHTLRIAQSLGIAGDELVHIQRGALLHDIGKLGVPDEILLKPGRLTPDEWCIMRQHPEYARSMLSDIEYLLPSIAIPYSHHEKWDGSGYPEGLKGEDIPLPARIFAIVDVYDALTHDRTYRPAWSDKDARKYLVEQSGTHFDPAIVDLFLSNI